MNSSNGPADSGGYSGGGGGSDSGDPRGNEANGMNSSNGPADSGGYSGGGGGENSGNYSGSNYGSGNFGNNAAQVASDAQASESAAAAQGNGGGGTASERQQADRYSNNEATSAQNNAMAQASANAQAEADMRAAQSQGRGSNVTDMQPQPPAFTAIENLSRNINPISFPGGSSATSMWSPTMSGFAVQPTTNTIGVPTIVLDSLMPTTPIAPSFQDSPYGIKKLSATTPQEDAINDYLKKTGYIESKNNPSAFNKSTSAFGEYQLLPSTALGLMKKYHGDMIDGMTDEQITRSVIMNQELQKTLTTDLTKENMASLQRYLINPTDTNTYLSHWFGAGGANGILKAASDTPIESIIGQEVASKNKLLGMTTADVIGKASSAMKTAGMASNNTGIGSAGGYGKLAENLVSPIMSDVRPSVGGSKVAPDAVAAATKAPESFSDWLGSLFDQSGQIAKVLAEPNRVATIPGLPNTTSGMTKEEWASNFGVDPSEVKARISTINGAPQVDYYSKDLLSIPGDMVKNIGEGIGSLFGGRDVSKLPQGSSVRDPQLSDMFTGPTRADYGPYGNMTLEQYRKEYGGNGGYTDTGTSAPVTTTSSLSPTASTPAAQELVASMPTMDYHIRKYRPGRLVVETPDYLPS